MQTRLLALPGLTLALAALTTTSVHADAYCKDPSNLPRPPLDRSWPDMCHFTFEGTGGADDQVAAGGYCTLGSVRYKISIAEQGYQASVCAMSSRNYQDELCDYGYLTATIYCGVTQDDPNPQPMGTLDKTVVVGPEGAYWCDGLSLECPSAAPYVSRVEATYDPVGTVGIN